MVNADFAPYELAKGRTEVIRGSHIGQYVVFEQAKQGEALYFDEAKWRRDHAGASVLSEIKDRRVVYQRYAAIDNYRRLIAAIVPPGRWCSHTTGYLRSPRYAHEALVAFLNSDAPEWRFSQSSTNNNINAYELDALPVPRFARMRTNNPAKVPVDWKRWDGVLARSQDGDLSAWEQAVLAEVDATTNDAEVWPDAIHDALAAAGKEMSRLGEERQQLTSGFAAWLVKGLTIDEDRFSGMTHIQGGQADFDHMGWQAFCDMLTRNRRACGVDPATIVDRVKTKYTESAANLTANRERFDALDAAINRIVWQLVGLSPDGSLPTDAPDGQVGEG